MTTTTTEDAHVARGKDLAVSSTVWNASYWASAGFAALSLGTVGAADLLRAPAIMESVAHLG